MMSTLLSWFDLIWRGLIEVFVTNQLLRYFKVGICESKTRLDGQVVVITGASDGIGKATALFLAQRGAKIVMAVRNVKKAEKAILDIICQAPNADIDVVELECSSLESVRKCADTIKKNYPTVDVLVNNAGLWVDTHEKTKDGFEIHFGVNCLSHFALTLLLLDNIKKSKNGKVVNVSSLAHRFSSLELETLGMDTGQGNLVRYGKSKLAQVLFTKELAARCPSIKVYAIHPGSVKTQMSSDPNVSRFGNFLQDLLLRTPEEGAQTILHCILNDQADQESGLYYADCKVQTPSKEAQSSYNAKAVWKKSLDMVKLNEEDINC